jgi:hypothetical protein
VKIAEIGEVLKRLGCRLALVWTGSHYLASVTRDGFIVATRTSKNAETAITETIEAVKNPPF